MMGYITGGGWTLVRIRLYRSYLLRLYRDLEPGKETWRVVLEDPVSAERYRFLDLRALIRFLEEEMRASSGGSKGTLSEEYL